MGFVNEYYTPEDVKRYHLAEIDDKYGLGLSRGDSWTVDRARGFYLRRMEQGREHEAGQQVFDFLLGDRLLRVRLTVEGGGKIGESGWRHYGLMRVDLVKKDFRCPPRPEKIHPEIEPYLNKILPILKEALTAYRNFGVYTKTTTFTATFDF